MPSTTEFFFFGTFQFTTFFLDHHFKWVWPPARQVYIICLTRDAHTLSPGQLKMHLWKFHSIHGILPQNTLLPIKINALSILSTHFHPPTWCNKHVSNIIQKNGTYTVYKTSNKIQHDSTTRSLKIKDNSYKRSWLNMQNSVHIDPWKQNIPCIETTVTRHTCLWTKRGRCKKQKMLGVTYIHIYTWKLLIHSGTQ